MAIRYDAEFFNLLKNSVNLPEGIVFNTPADLMAYVKAGMDKMNQLNDQIELENNKAKMANEFAPDGEQLPAKKLMTLDEVDPGAAKLWSYMVGHDQEIIDLTAKASLGAAQGKIASEFKLDEIREKFSNTEKLTRIKGSEERAAQQQKSEGKLEEIRTKAQVGLEKLGVTNEHALNLVGAKAASKKDTIAAESAAKISEKAADVNNKISLAGGVAKASTIGKTEGAIEARKLDAADPNNPAVIKIRESDNALKQSLKVLGESYKAGLTLPTLTPGAEGMMTDAAKQTYNSTKDRLIISAKKEAEKLVVTEKLDSSPLALQIIDEASNKGRITPQVVERAKAAVEYETKFLPTQTAEPTGRLNKWGAALGLGGNPQDAMKTAMTEAAGMVKAGDAVGARSLIERAAKAAASAPGKSLLKRGGLAGGGILALLAMLKGRGGESQMNPMQQLAIQQQMQEQQQKQMLVESLINQRNAGAENDMAKAMMLKLQAMQAMGGGGQQGGGIL